MDKPSTRVPVNPRLLETEMNLTARFFAGAAIAIVAASSALAADRATKDEAVAFANRAAAYWKKSGRDGALAEFNNQKGQFVDRDLYVFALDAATGKALAHGANAKLVGRDLAGLKDPEGKLFVKEMLQVSTAGKPAWVDYKWPNPVTQQLEAKSSYVLKVDDIVIGVGVYK